MKQIVFLDNGLSQPISLYLIGTELLLKNIWQKQENDLNLEQTRQHRGWLLRQEEVDLKREYTVKTQSEIASQSWILTNSCMVLMRVVCIRLLYCYDSLLRMTNMLNKLHPWNSGKQVKLTLRLFGIFWAFKSIKIMKNIDESRMYKPTHLECGNCYFHYMLSWSYILRIPGI